MRVSPAAAAGVSRILQGAGLKRATEIAKGVETEGFYASPERDHVRIEFVASPFAEEVDHAEIISKGLDLCFEALKDHYDVERAVAMLAFPGEMREGPVLEVRNGSWGR